jgi:catechol 2,3-dioxygenase-like lactoylglutathione lyase family enzyme
MHARPLRHPIQGHREPVNVVRGIYFCTAIEGQLDIKPLIWVPDLQGHNLSYREDDMRGLALFVAGTLVGIAATSMAQNQGPNRGVVGINHVALAVPDIEKAVEHYTKVMGFPEAFRVKTPQGEVQLVYIQVSKDTFIELQTINAERPAGIYHFGVVVDDMAQATAMWKARGADVREIRPSSGTKAILSNIHDPNGVRMELLQLPPDSLHAQATSRWK